MCMLISLAGLRQICRGSIPQCVLEVLISKGPIIPLLTGDDSEAILSSLFFDEPRILSISKQTRLDLRSDSLHRTSTLTYRSGWFINYCKIVQGLHLLKLSRIYRHSSCVESETKSYSYHFNGCVCWRNVSCESLICVFFIWNLWICWFYGTETLR